MRRRRPPLILALLLGTILMAFRAVDRPLAQTRDVPSEPARSARTLPGVQSSGAVLLPNQWSLRPAGTQLELGDFPVNLAVHPNGQWLAALHAGYGEHEIVCLNLDAQRPRIACRVAIDQTFYGLCFSADGRQLYASGGEFEVVHVFDFQDGLLARRREITVADKNDKFVPGGLAVDSAGKWLFVCGTWGDAVALISLAAPEQRTRIAFEAESYPYACAIDPAGKRLHVSLWSKAVVVVIDLEEKKVLSRWATESHPTEMAFSPDGKLLYVACANSTKVSVLETATGKGLETISCALYPSAPSGNTPNSLSLSPDGALLFVANADANNVAMFNVATPGKSRPLGFLPVGWYPTSVRFNPVDKRIYVANGKGSSSRSNTQGPNPLVRRATVREYLAGLLRGTLSIIDLPTPQRMAQYSKQAYACSPLRQDVGAVDAPAEENPIPRKLGEPSAIKHCIYIIKENRTYDQVFGDIKEGNGDANLCIFPEKITPNHHKLAREFVLLDNFYADGEVSADGHEWSMGAYCTDFVEKIWPLKYRRFSGRPGMDKIPGHVSEGNRDLAARPAGGYIWDRCAEAGVSYFSYGEWITPGKTPKEPGTARVKALEGHFDPWFSGWDLNLPDQKRADRFVEELARYERESKMPSLILLRLPNDHTAGSRVGMPTPTAMVADNDLALGRVVEAISHSKFWKETAIFVVEDDAQNGADHVDAHRTVALVISPYTKRGHVDSSMYSTSSMLRTMELILGLKPMSQFDAAARPMYRSFQTKPDEKPYRHLLPQVDWTEKNKASAWGAQESADFDFAHEDKVDDLLLNEVIWRSVRGPRSPMPPPVRAAFVFPHLKAGPS